MTKKFEFELNHEGVVQLLKSPEMQSLLESRASSAQSQLGDGYNSEVLLGKDRAVAFIRAESLEARRENSKDNKILKAVR